jgi:hypothetical protein
MSFMSYYRPGQDRLSEMLKRHTDELDETEKAVAKKKKSRSPAAGITEFDLCV